MLSTSSATEVPNANIIKGVLKLQESVVNSATYYFSSRKGNAWILQLYYY